MVFLFLLLQISKIAYEQGLIVTTCRHCKSRHLIADNTNSMDMAEFGPKIEDYLRRQGETVTKLTLTPKQLEDNYLIDYNGQLTLVPKTQDPQV